jgi:hypothetical protein
MTHAGSYLIEKLSSKSFDNVLLPQICHILAAYTLNDPEDSVYEAKHEMNFVQHVEVNNTYSKSKFQQPHSAFMSTSVALAIDKGGMWNLESTRPPNLETPWRSLPM